MDEGRKRATTRNGVVAGSVWESRMKMDEVKGGIKVFNGEEISEENGENTTSTSCNSGPSGLQVYKRLRPKQSIAAASGKRKTWKSESFEGPLQIARQKSDSSKNLDERSKELSASADGIKRSPVQIKARSEVGKEMSASVDSIGRSPNQKMKGRSVSMKGSSDSGDVAEKNSSQLRKVKSDSGKALDDGIEMNAELKNVKSESGKASDGGSERNAELRKVKLESNKALNESVVGKEKSPVQLTKAKSVPSKVLDETGESQNGLDDGIEKNSAELDESKSKYIEGIDGTEEGIDGSEEGIEKNPVEIVKSGSNETCKEFGMCEEKAITSSFDNAGHAKFPPGLVVADDADPDGDEEYWDDDELEEEVDEEIDIEVEKTSVDVKEISIPEPVQTPKKVVVEEKKFHQSNEKPVPVSPLLKRQPSLTVKSHQKNEKPIPISPLVKKQPPPANYPRSHPSPTKAIPTRVSDEFPRYPMTHSKLQSLVDLVMWKEVSKSAFVFGIGTFVIISSSYTKDLNISLISVVSYLGLVYLAAIFIFRSIIYRGAVYIDDSSQEAVVGEEDAVWLLRLVLPYVNEFLIKLRALFSGDPATTMKLAALLFVLARGGSSITIWKMAKLGFFGVFTVPKICSSYSRQLTAYGTFWIRRFRDAWESCSHKKAVAFVIFTLIWNLSSIVARIWAVFMLFVAFRYYQQSLIREDWVEEEAEGGDASWQGQIGGQRHGRGPTLLEIKKQKKAS